jgi:hypothetical protein
MNGERTLWGVQASISRGRRDLQHLAAPVGSTALLSRDDHHSGSRSRLAEPPLPLNHDGALRLDVDLLAAVIGTTDPVLRSERIALAHSRFAAELEPILHCSTLTPDRWAAAPNACWFSLALWANTTILRHISHELPPRPIDDALPPISGDWVRRTVCNLRLAGGQRISALLSLGQLLVFASAASTACDFVATSRAGISIDSAGGNEARREWLDLLRSYGVMFPHGHMQRIAAGFRAYERARDARTERERAQWILLGNCEIARCEQVLLEPIVAAIVEHPVQSQVASTLWARLARARLHEHHLAVAARDVWARTIFRHLFVLCLPRETLKLGRPLPGLDPAHPERPFPTDLGDPIEVPALAEFLGMWDCTHGHPSRWHATDWRDLRARIAFATNVFRSRQQDETWRWDPYTGADAERVIVGERARITPDPHRGAVYFPVDAGAHALRWDRAADGADRRLFELTPELM